MQASRPGGMDCGWRHNTGSLLLRRIGVACLMVQGSAIRRVRGCVMGSGPTLGIDLNIGWKPEDHSRIVWLQFRSSTNL